MAGVVFRLDNRRCAYERDVMFWAKVASPNQGAVRHAWVMEDGRLAPLCAPGRGPNGPNKKTAMKLGAKRGCETCVDGVKPNDFVPQPPAPPIVVRESRYARIA